MPHEEIAKGCLEVVMRVFLECIKDSAWRWCQFLGSMIFYPFSLGKIWLEDEHPILAGVLGIAAFIGALILILPSRN